MVDGPVPADPSGVVVDGLSKVYGPSGEVRAIDDLSLEFPAGQCTVLLGPSGCGKTTVLRSIAGLVTPTTGRIRIGPDLVFDAQGGRSDLPESRHLGMVFQSYALWPHLSVAENIAYPLAGRAPKQSVRADVNAMLDWIGLSGMGARYIHELSGGQQQRVSLGRALIGKPRAVLFDEPLSNLDARLREKMRLEILALRQRAPFTSIYVTHDQLEAMTLGDRVVIMHAGRVEQMGTPEDVYRTPRTRFAADFMGIPNLIDGIVHSRDRECTVVDTIVGQLRCRGWRTDWVSGARCTVALRATLLEIAVAKGGPGRVVRSVFQGTSTLHIVDLNGALITIESLSDERQPAGTNVGVRPTTGAVFALLDD